MTLQTRYDFTLPRGYVDAAGEVHRTGTMRLATARDELEPLRDPTIDGPDDPRLTVVVLARVVERLGSLELVTSREIEGLFAVDLAFLQDFYGVINFGSQAEYDELLAAQAELAGPVVSAPVGQTPADQPVPAPEVEAAPVAQTPEPAPVEPTTADGRVAGPRPGRSAIEEIPNSGR